MAGSLGTDDSIRNPPELLLGNPGGQSGPGRLDGAEGDFRRAGYGGWKASTQKRDNRRKIPSVIVEPAKKKTSNCSILRRFKLIITHIE